jgi:hypothetical protein
MTSRKLVTIKYMDRSWPERVVRVSLRESSTFDDGRHYIPDSIVTNRVFLNFILFIFSDDPLCPVKSFIMYKRHLNPKCSRFFQRPSKGESPVNWCTNAPVGHNAIGNSTKSQQVAIFSSSFCLFFFCFFFLVNSKNILSYIIYREWMVYLISGFFSSITSNSNVNTLSSVFTTNFDRRGF